MSDNYDILMPEAQINPTANFPTVRMRRLRQHPKLRDLVRENILTRNDLVMPIFIKDGTNIENPVSAMPGIFQLSLDKLDQEIKTIAKLKIPAVCLFGIPASKDAIGSNSLQSNGIIQRAIQKIKSLAPEILIISDLCFCEYTNHGHCGVIDDKQDVDNDKTLTLLAKQAVSHAAAGADMLAPSGMIDGAVQAIRKALDAAGFKQTAILSHTAKYASALYGPFREAAEGAPKFGDRRSYQMDPANGDRAFREAELDIIEGADCIMIKPANFYADVIYRIKKKFPAVPLAAYQVSGEYSMIKAAAKNGWINEQQVAMESLISLKRAGADFIITYFAKEIAAILSE